MDLPALPDDIREAAMALARMRYERDGASASVTLSDCFDQDHPEAGQDGDIDAYFEDEWAPARLADAWAGLHGLLAEGSGTLTAYRNVCIAGDPLEGFLDHYRREGWVGIFWAVDRDAAHPHETAPGAPPGVLLEGRVEAGAVDWVATLASYAHPDWVGEEEVRLLPDAGITLVSMHRREGWLRRNGDDEGIEVPLGEWAGHRFKAGDPAMAHGPDADGGAPAGMAP